MAVRNINPVIERQARLLAADNREAAPDVERILWFPHDAEVRLIEFTEQVPVYMDEQLHPFYFRPSPEDDLPAPTAVVMIRPGEYGKIRLPTDWGEWSDGIDL